MKYIEEICLGEEKKRNTRRWDCRGLMFRLFFFFFFIRHRIRTDVIAQSNFNSHHPTRSPNACLRAVENRHRPAREDGFHAKRVKDAVCNEKTLTNNICAICLQTDKSAHLEQGWELE